MHEFQLIGHFFAPLACQAVEVPLGDDAAVIQADGATAICTDTLVSGRHFMEGAPADAVAWKALAVNVSDLLAMNAHPQFYTLALTLPQADEVWLAEFARGLAEAQQAFGCCLLGGDMTGGDTLTLSITALGRLRGAPWRRSGAKVGDVLMLTGPVGAAALGLRQLLDKKTPVDEGMVAAQLKPQLPLTAWARLADYKVHAAIDISDGLVQDAGHIAAASGVGLRIDWQRVPLPPAVTAWCAEYNDPTLALAGGEDYQLLLSVPPDEAARIEHAGLAVAIGTVVAGQGVEVLDHDRPLPIQSGGFQHF